MPNVWAMNKSNVLTVVSALFLNLAGEEQTCFYQAEKPSRYITGPEHDIGLKVPCCSDWNE